MSPEEATKACWEIGKLFRDIAPEQMATMSKRFHLDVYRLVDVVQSAEELRPVTNFFDYERFNAIWNRIRQQNADPKESLRKAIDDLRKSEARKKEHAMRERKAAIQARIRELGQEQRAKLAQAAINRLPEDLRNLYDAMAAMKRDPFEIASIREVAGEILGAA